MLWHMYIDDKISPAIMSQITLFGILESLEPCVLSVNAVQHCWQIENLWDHNYRWDLELIMEPTSPFQNGSATIP